VMRKRHVHQARVQQREVGDRPTTTIGGEQRESLGALRSEPACFLYHQLPKTGG
jgi:hypothetical protein